MPTERQDKKLPTADAAHPSAGQIGGTNKAPLLGVNPDVKYTPTGVTATDPHGGNSHTDPVGPSQNIKHTPAGGTLKGDRGYIDERTREWAIRARARGTYSSNVWKTVTDPKKCAGFGIEPVTASRSGWDNCMRRVSPAELKAARDEYLSTFEDVELAQKKVRVLELARMYRKFNVKARKGNLSASCECRLLLKQIADEVGEDARLEAVAKSGGAPVQAVTPELLRELAFLIAGELKPEPGIASSSRGASTGAPPKLVMDTEGTLVAEDGRESS